MKTNDPAAHKNTLIRTILKLNRPLLPEKTGVEMKLEDLPDIRAILFDVYGTLFISGSGDIGTAGVESGTAGGESDTERLREALKDAGLAGDLERASESGAALFHEEITACHRRREKEGIAFPEIDVIEVWKQVTGQLHSGGLLTGSPSEAALELLAVAYENRTNPVWPMPHLKNILHRLKGKKTVTGIISNAQFYTPLLFSAFLGETPEALGFRDELCAWSYRMLEAKPSDVLFREVLYPLKHQHDIEAEQALFVGNDILNDIAPAMHCGMKTALFAGDKRSLRLRSDDPRAGGVTPDLVITGLKQLSRFFSPGFAHG